MAAEARGAKSKQASTQKRPYISQADVPSVSLQQALRVATAIVDNYAGSATRPLGVAQALEMSPVSGPFRALCGASIAYGLTEGGYNAAEIKLTPLAKRILQPTDEGDDARARREALLKPRVFGEFLKRYDGAKIPREEIAQNVLREMGVPGESLGRVLKMIREGAEETGSLRDIKGEKYVDLDKSSAAVVATESDEPTDVQEGNGATGENRIAELLTPSALETKGSGTVSKQAGSSGDDENRKRKVFVTHGKNKAFIDPLKKLLKFGELEAVLAVERQSVSQPVPDKVMADMRGCGAAVIHVDVDERLHDQEGKERSIINPNVLIEIGAALALYGRRFILLVPEGLQLPSNLQGMYEVRYKGVGLDAEATIKLLESINDIKNHSLPG